MKIKSISCDICKKEYDYPTGQKKHFHKEYEIGGVPINIWTPSYMLQKERELTVKNEKGIFKYKKYLPNSRYEYSLDEGNTPLLRLKDFSLNYNFQIYLKDESRNPTGSFKDRGISLLVSDAKESGKKKIAIPSTGNAAISLTKYAMLANIESIVFTTKSISDEKLNALGKFSQVMPEKDLIKCYESFFEFCKKNKEVYNGFPVTSIPYSQGAKTMAYELYSSLGKAPDWMIIPCGSGGNIVSQYHGFKDLLDIGLIKKMPHFVSVQISGADPITKGYGKKHSEKIVVIKNPVKSKADAIASDTCFNYFKIMGILSKTNGLAVSVSDNEISNYSNKFGWLEFSSVSVFPAVEKIKRNIKENEDVVLIGTASSREEK